MSRFANEQHLLRLELESKLQIQEQLAAMYAGEAANAASPMRRGKTPMTGARGGQVTPLMEQRHEIFQQVRASRIGWHFLFAWFARHFLVSPLARVLCFAGLVVCCLVPCWALRVV